MNSNIPITPNDQKNRRNERKPRSLTEKILKTNFLSVKFIRSTVVFLSFHYSWTLKHYISVHSCTNYDGNFNKPQA